MVVSLSDLVFDICLFSTLKSVGLCEYISNSVARFHSLHYFFLVWSVQNLWLDFFYRVTTMLIGRPFFLPAGRRRRRRKLSVL